MIERWRKSFLDDPERAVADLFNGRAGLVSGLRLDIPELLYQEFPGRPGQQGERERLDGALLQWLHGMRLDCAAQVRRLGRDVYAKRLCDALVAVQLLRLPGTACHIRQNPDAWLDWLAPFYIAPERNPAQECRRVLSSPCKLGLPQADVKLMSKSNIGCD